MNAQKALFLPTIQNEEIFYQILKLSMKFLLVTSILHGAHTSAHIK